MTSFAQPVSYGRNKSRFLCVGWDEGPSEHVPSRLGMYACCNRPSTLYLICGSLDENGDLTWYSHAISTGFSARSPLVLGSAPRCHSKPGPCVYLELPRQEDCIGPHFGYCELRAVVDITEVEEGKFKFNGFPAIPLLEAPATNDWPGMCTDALVQPQCFDQVVYFDAPVGNRHQLYHCNIFSREVFHYAKLPRSSGQVEDLRDYSVRLRAVFGTLLLIELSRLDYYHRVYLIKTDQIIEEKLQAQILSRWINRLPDGHLQMTTWNETHTYLYKPDTENSLQARGIIGFRAAPIIVVLHGGPHACATIAYSPAISYFAELGFCVLLLNGPGSTGMGQKSVTNSAGRIGTKTCAEVAAIIRTFRFEWEQRHALQYGNAISTTNVTQGKDGKCVDPPTEDADVGECGEYCCPSSEDEYSQSRVPVFLMGGSYGGYMALQLIGKEREHGISFTAASVRNPVTNLASMMGTSDIPDWCFYECTGRPYPASGQYNEEDLQTMFQASPVRHVSRVSTPLLLALGEDDLRVPPSQGLEYMRLLRATENPPVTRLLSYPDNGHSLDHPTANKDYMINTARWFFSTAKAAKERNDVKKKLSSTRSTSTV